MNTELIREFERLWESGDETPDVFAFLSKHPDSNRSQRLAVLLHDQKQRWLIGAPLTVEDYFAKLPDLASDPHCTLELAIGEFRARQDADTSPDIEEFASRFPEIGDPLRQSLSNLVSNKQAGNGHPDSPESDRSFTRPSQLEPLYDLFEQACQAAGESPAIESYLQRCSDQLRGVVLPELIQIELWWRRERRGEQPEQSEYRVRFPDDAKLVDEAFLQSEQTFVTSSKVGDARRGRHRSERVQSEGVPTTIGSPQTLSSDVTSSGAIVIRRVGDYEIIDEIARGGMGVVYKAWDKELKCHVALKTIRSGEFAGQNEIERFHREAEAAAHLQHPGIVRVHRFGQHGGLHYFTMDYVDGQSLDEMTRNGPLDIETAVGFAIEICEAVEFAHLHGILHRDLKPANVLISRESGRALVTDFGLAKRVEEESDFTQTGQAIGTPAYMPPEQAEGRKHDVTYQSDVYSAGALLYHLLAGSPPFTGRTHHEILNRVVNEIPTPPSKLNPLVGRDLNTVCLKCLEKNPASRYMSAAELRDDLRRYSQGFPVRARPVTAIQRGWRWCRRNRLIANLGLLISIVMVVVIALGLALVYNKDAQLSMAKGSLDRAIKTAMRNTEDDALIPTEVRDDADGLRVALNDYNQLRSSFYHKLLARWSTSGGEADIAVQRRSAEALFSVAQANRLLGQFSESEKNFVEAIRRFKDLREVSVRDPDFAVMHGKSLDYLGELYREYGTLDLHDAESQYKDSLQVLTDCVGEFPHYPEAQLELARSENNYGVLLQLAARNTEAEPKYKDAKARLRELVDDHPGNVDYRRDYARTLINVGLLSENMGNSEKAESSYKLAIEQFQSLLQSDSNDPQYRYRFLLALARMNLGFLHETNGRFSQAERLYNQALDGFKALPASNPSYRFHLAKCLINLANTIAKRGGDQQGRSTKYFDEARQELLKLVERHPNVPEIESWMGRVHGSLGWMADQERDYDRFVTHLQKAISHQQKAADGSVVYAEVLKMHHSFFGTTILEHYLDEDSESRKMLATEQIVSAIEYGYRDDFSHSRFDAIRDEPPFIAAISKLNP